MPIGIQRLNAPRPQPSSRIIFIKPLPGTDSAYAHDFLERIAAICHPVMTHAHLSIMTLEEHEPNAEFIGRNFNAGEIIQLVLKAPHTGHWLSFRSVQMVMMHELAHCAQMNHGRVRSLLSLGQFISPLFQAGREPPRHLVAGLPCLTPEKQNADLEILRQEFWKVRNRFAGELRELWAKGYTGDGLWGRGQTLLSGEYHGAGRAVDEVLPAQVCGGTFRSRRGGKRKRGGGGVGEKKQETYAERQQRRIKKKFGVNGVALGGDEETKVKLEKGKKAKGKPRVAGSLRGRELRAAAALARFEQKKEEEEDVKDEEWMLSGSETESDYEEAEVKGEAFDIDGSRMLDSKGRGMVKVCEDEDQDDVHVKQEIEELQGLGDVRTSSPATTAARDRTPVDRKESRHAERAGTSLGQLSTPSYTDPPDRTRMQDIPQYVEKKDQPSAKNMKAVHINVRPLPRVEKHTSNEKASPPEKAPTATSGSSEMICPICSMSNGPGSVLCIACSHVLDTSKITRYWQCRSEACQGSQYINAADCGRCGICGARKDESEI